MNNPKAREEIEAFERFNQEVPASLIAPDLHDVEGGIWTAFWELSAERAQESAIGWHSINRYATFIGMEPSILSRLIRQMDDAYMAHKSGDGKTFTRDMMKR